MYKLWMLLLAVLVNFSAVAQEEDAPVELGPLDGKYMGTHGMVLMNAGASLFVSHLPLYEKPHDVQLVYEVKVGTSAVNIMVKDADLVTIKPAEFNLQRLMRGESFTVKADVYLGHFERGGILTHPQIDITFEEKLYVRELKDLAPAGRQQIYDTIDIGHGQRILVHQITQAPSYDQLILLYDNQGCLTQFNTSNPVPKRGEVFMALSMCGSMKPLHYETEDFR